MNNDVRKELATELKRIYNDKDFVYGVLAILNTGEHMQIMIDFIRESKENRDVITSDNIIILAMKLAEDDTIVKNTKRQVVAML